MQEIDRQQQLLELKSRLGIDFISEKTLNQALTHSSYVNESKNTDLADNERLEFLGDAILKLVVSEYIYSNFPNHSEGQLTKMRAAVVSDASLSELSRELGLGRYILLGNNEKNSGGDKKRSNLANALESIIAAVFMEGGLEHARPLVVNLIKEPIAKASAEDFIIDYKSALQELCQKNKWGLPFYHVAKETGPKHKRVFWIEVKVKSVRYGEGKGYSKKEAEQSAAKEALNFLKENKPKEDSIGTIFSRFLPRRKRQ